MLESPFRFSARNAVMKCRLIALSRSCRQMGSSNQSMSHKLLRICGIIERWHRESGGDGSVAWSNPVECRTLQGQLTPLRIDRYALRDGSGGNGAQRGGDGIVRAYRATAPCTVTLLTERRRHAPRGVVDGGNGATGRNLLNGEPIAAKCRMTLKAGDVITIETPGGGGYGRE